MDQVTTRALLRLAVPSIAFAVLTNGYRLVDQYWMAQVSTPAQAAVGTSIFVLILFYAAFALVAAGVAPLVARATGAGDPEMRRRIIGAGLFGGLVLAGLFTVIGGVGAQAISDALGLRGETNVECTRYLSTLSFTILPLVLIPIVDHAFISMGNGRVPMLLHIVSLLLNMVLTPALAVHAELGVVGAALASNGSRAVTTSIALWLLWREAGMKRSYVVPAELKRVMKVGAPVALRVAAYAIVYWLVVRVAISPLGPHVNAALGVGFTALEGFTWPTFYGLSIAVASFVGRALGPDVPRTRGGSSGGRSRSRRRSDSAPWRRSGSGAASSPASSPRIRWFTSRRPSTRTCSRCLNSPSPTSRSSTECSTEPEIRSPGSGARRR